MYVFKSSCEFISNFCLNIHGYAVAAVSSNDGLRDPHLTDDVSGEPEFNRDGGGFQLHKQEHGKQSNLSSHVPTFDLSSTVGYSILPSKFAQFK